MRRSLQPFSSRSARVQTSWIIVDSRIRQRVEYTEEKSKQQRSTLPLVDSRQVAGACHPSTVGRPCLGWRHLQASRQLLFARLFSGTKVTDQWTRVLVPPRMFPNLRSNLRGKQVTLRMSYNCLTNQRPWKWWSLTPAWTRGIHGSHHK